MKRGLTSQRDEIAFDTPSFCMIMSYKYVFFLLSIFAFVNTNANSYLKYYQQINRAEVCISLSDYDSALRYYQTAFQTVSSPYAKDLYNSAICAAIISKDSILFILLEKCVKKGISILRFEENTLVFNQKNKKILEVLKKQEKTYYDEYKKGLNQAYLGALQLIDQEDQRVRKKKKFFRSSKKRNSDISYMDSINRSSLDSLYLLYGYPDEQAIGIGNGLECRQFISIFHRIEPNYIEEIQYKALTEGKLSPSQYARKIDYSKEMIDMQPIYYYYPYNLPNKTTEKHVNENRIKIGLPTISEEEIIKNYLIQTKNLYQFYFHIPFLK